MMKVAVISDIHGNLPALQAATADLAAWQPDQVIVAGDVVNRGPCSLDCWLFVRQRMVDDGWQVVRGNHEDYVVYCADAGLPMSGPAFKIRQYAHWTWQQLDGFVPLLAALPDWVNVIAPDGRELRVVHGSMRSNRDGVYPKTTDADLRLQIAPPPAVFVTAHTHRPLLRQVDETLVVNVGAVGAPFDGDKRLSYGRFVWQEGVGWQADVVRLAYDWHQTERDYENSGFLVHGGPLAQLMLLELRRSGGLIYRWADRYQEKILAGEITLEESVWGIMADADVRPYVGPPGWSLDS